VKWALQARIGRDIWSSEGSHDGECQLVLLLLPQTSHHIVSQRPRLRPVHTSYLQRYLINKMPVAFDVRYITSFIAGVVDVDYVDEATTMTAKKLDTMCNLLPSPRHSAWITAFGYGRRKCVSFFLARLVHCRRHAYRPTWKILFEKSRQHAAAILTVNIVKSAQSVQAPTTTTIFGRQSTRSTTVDQYYICWLFIIVTTASLTTTTALSCRCAKRFSQLHSVLYVDSAAAT